MVEAQTRIVYDGIVCMIATTRVQYRIKVARLVCPTILSFLFGLVTRLLLLLTLVILYSLSLLLRSSPLFSIYLSLSLRLSLSVLLLPFQLPTVIFAMSIILLPYWSVVIPCLLIVLMRRNLSCIIPYFTFMQSTLLSLCAENGNVDRFCERVFSQRRRFPFFSRRRLLSRWRVEKFLFGVYIRSRDE